MGARPADDQAVSTHEDLLVVKGEAWTELVINRPAKHNALTPDLLFSVADHIRGLRDPAVVVLRAAGDAAFSSGFDISVLREQGVSAHDGDPLGSAVAALRACPAPVVAALQGYCWGAALELAAACDVRVGAQNLSIAAPASKLGSMYRLEAITALASRFGWQTAADLLVAGVQFDADLALARGVVCSVVPTADLVEETRRIARRIHETAAAASLHKQFLVDLEAANPGPPEEFWERWHDVHSADIRGSDPG